MEKHYRVAQPSPAAHATASWQLTPDVVLVRVVDLLHSAVAESQLPHPVHSAVDPGAQAQRAGPRRALEAVRTEVVGAAPEGGGQGLESWFLKNTYWPRFYIHHSILHNQSEEVRRSKRRRQI